MNFIRCILGFFTRVNTKNEDGYTHLHIAANKGEVSLMKHLISRGANVRARNRTRDTPLHGAAENGHKDAVALLIAKGANVNAKGILGLTPLHETTDKEIAEMLIANRADIHAKNDEGSTPLTRAFGYHSIGKTAEIIKLLIARGADVNSCDSDGDTLLHAAISGYEDDLVKLAIAKGADVNAKDQNGQTALHFVAKRSDETAVELAELLISKGAHVNPHDDEGITPLYKAALSYGDCKIALVKFLLAKGVNINEKNEFGDAPLDLAMRECDGGAVKLLIANGACSVSRQALIWAACVGTVEELKRVIANGADLNTKDDEGETTLIKAAGEGRTASVEALIAAGADVNARKTSGYTALMAAANNGRSEIVKALIAAGAEVNVQYKNGKTALMYGYNYPDVVAVLRAAGASDGSSAKEESEKTFHFAGVTWQREAAPGTMNLEDAHSYAFDLTLAGGGWRLPTVDELKALYSAKLSSPAIAAHPGMHKGWYWSGSPYPEGNTYCVNFDNGSVAGNVNGKAIMVRCVRSAAVPQERRQPKSQAGEVSGLTPQAETRRVPLRSSAHPSHKLALEADALEGDELLKTIDTALTLCPQDPDLLYAKACAVSDLGFLSEKSKPIIEQVRILHPEHVDVALKSKQFGFKRPLPESWEGVFYFNKWSEDSTELQGLMSSRLSQGKHVQIVRHCLTPTFAMVYGADYDFCEKINRMRWELRWVKTPHGDIAAHYLVMNWGNNETRRNEGFLPPAVSNPPSPMDGYCLLHRLAQTDHCFLVLADSDGGVLRNELFEFPESLKHTLRDVKNQLDRIGPCNPMQPVDRAAKWCMDNTDLNSITF